MCQLGDVIFLHGAARTELAVLNVLIMSVLLSCSAIAADGLADAPIEERVREFREKATIPERASIIEDICTEELDLVGQELLLQTLLEEMLDGTNRGIALHLYSLVGWALSECGIGPEVVIRTTALSLRDEHTMEAYDIRALLDQTERKLSKEKSLPILIEIFKSFSSIEDGHEVSRHILRSHEARGLRELNDVLPDRLTVRESDCNAAQQLNDCIRLYEKKVAFNEPIDIEHCDNLIRSWAKDVNWLKRLYVLETTRKFPELVGRNLLEVLIHDSHSAVRSSANENVRVLDRTSQETKHD